MPQVNISLSTELHALLVELAKLTGLAKSGLAAEYVRRGIYEDAARHRQVLYLQKDNITRLNESD
ncbi:MAG: hypothetical protein F6K36_29230 [Symploca sp. SIO3C6]|nr:hypothetical protein [Symploca sp. SIO3C6]